MIQDTGWIKKGQYFYERTVGGLVLTLYVREGDYLFILQEGTVEVDRAYLNTTTRIADHLPKAQKEADTLCARYLSARAESYALLEKAVRGA